MIIFGFKNIRELKVMSALMSFLKKDVSAAVTAADERTFEAIPQKEPVDYAALRKSLYARFSKSYEKLAQ